MVPEFYKDVFTEFLPLPLYSQLKADS